MGELKTVTYRDLEGKDFTVKYDPDAPCILCGEPVVAASMGGTVVCPWCDCGNCRYCGVQASLMGEHIDGGRSLRKWKEHMVWHNEQKMKDE